MDGLHFLISHTCITAPRTASSALKGVAPQKAPVQNPVHWQLSHDCTRHISSPSSSALLRSLTLVQRKSGKEIRITTTYTHHQKVMSAPAPNAQPLYLGPSGKAPEPESFLSWFWNKQVMNPEYREGNIG